MTGQESRGDIMGWNGSKAFGDQRFLFFLSVLSFFFCLTLFWRGGEEERWVAVQCTLGSGGCCSWWEYYGMVPLERPWLLWDGKGCACVHVCALQARVSEILWDVSAVQSLPT